MTDTFHDTLTAEAQERETLEHDTREISDKLEDIRFMYPQLADTMLTIGSQALDLTGVRGTTQRIPGGDALTMLAPYSVGYDEPDDLPHPAQVVREWADRWRDATRTPHRPGEKWASHLAILQANTAWYIRQDQSGAFRERHPRTLGTTVQARRRRARESARARDHRRDGHQSAEGEPGTPDHTQGGWAHLWNHAVDDHHLAITWPHRRREGLLPSGRHSRTTRGMSRLQCTRRL